MAASVSHVKLLQKLKDLAKELQLTQQELSDQLWWSKFESGETAWLMAARRGYVKLLQNCGIWLKNCS